MHETFLVAPHIYEGGVEALHYFAHFAEVDVSHGILAAGLFAVQLHEALVLEQGYLHPFGCARYYEVFIQCVSVV